MLISDNTARNPILPKNCRVNRDKNCEELEERWFISIVEIEWLNKLNSLLAC